MNLYCPTCGITTPHENVGRRRWVCMICGRKERMPPRRWSRWHTGWARRTRPQGETNYKVDSLRVAKLCLKKALREKDEKHRNALLYQFCLQMKRYCALMVKESKNVEHKRRLKDTARAFGGTAKIFRSLGRPKDRLLSATSLPSRRLRGAEKASSEVR